MKKIVWLLSLILLFLATGCANQPTQAPQATPTAAQSAYDAAGFDAYLTSVQEQSAAIKTSLEEEELTQTDMNEKSQELYSLWEQALNDLMASLKTCLPEEDFAALETQQQTWNTEKQSAMDAAGKEFEGGSMHALIVNTEGAKLMEERVNELCALLK